MSGRKPEYLLGQGPTKNKSGIPLETKHGASNSKDGDLQETGNKGSPLEPYIGRGNMTLQVTWLETDNSEGNSLEAGIGGADGALQVA